MAINVKFTTKACGSEECISVNKHIIRIKKNYDVKFHNDLDSENNSDIAEVQFFDADDKGGSPLDGFCNGVPGPTLTVDIGKKVTCTVTHNPGDYAYTVKADDHLELDPIIIIEPQVAFFSTSLLLAGALLVGATLLAFWFGKSQGKGSI